MIKTKENRASVLVIVIITLLFATFALVAFMDKASNDLLVEQRDVEGRRLRIEAYSALEVTLAVLEDFRLANNGLHSPAEGWGNPLEFANYTPSEDRTVEISFEDESGKISLPRATPPTLVNLFKSWDIQQNDAESLADALTGWMTANHIYSTGLQPDYDRGEIPYLEPGRPIRSFTELAAIEKVREFFFTDGAPNEYWKRFVASISLFNFQRANINGGNTDALAALAQFDEQQRRNIVDYLNGTGTYERQGPGYFQSAADAQRIAGGVGDTAGFSTNIAALRVIVTVHEGRSLFRLAAVVAPQNGGATTVQTTATAQRAQASSTNTGPNAQNRPNPNQPNNPNQRTGRNAANDANAGNLRYPFTLLEIRENDEIPPPPSPPPTETF